MGSSLQQAQKAYEGATGKLTTGNGNLVGQAHKLSELGLKLRKVLPQELVDQSRANALLRQNEGDNDDAVAEPLELDAEDLEHAVDAA